MLKSFFLFEYYVIFIWICFIGADKLRCIAHYYILKQIDMRFQLVTLLVIFNIFSFARTFPTRRHKMKDKNRAGGGGGGSGGFFKRQPTGRSGRRTQAGTSNSQSLSPFGRPGRKRNPTANNNKDNILKTTRITTISKTVTANNKPSYKPTKNRNFFDGFFDEFVDGLKTSGNPKTDSDGRVETKIARDSKLSNAEQLKNNFKIYGSKEQTIAAKCSKRWLKHKLKKIVKLVKINNNKEEDEEKEIAEEYNKMLRKNNCE